MKMLMTVVALSALMAMPAQAQMGGGRRHGGGDDSKKADAPKKVDDKAYKAALERIPEPKEKYDPWGVTKPADPTKTPK